VRNLKKIIDFFERGIRFIDENRSKEAWMTENQIHMKKERKKRSTASKSRERSAEAPS